MGQQQLILLVLATVIVGIAIVVGIRAFTENSARANADGMMQDAVRMANDAQATLKKPDPFGGVDSFAEITFQNMGYSTTNPTTYTNTNGNFSLSASAAGVVFTGSGGDSFDVDDPDNDPNTNDSFTQYENTIAVAVCGPLDTDIDGAIVRLGNNDIGTAPACN